MNYERFYSFDVLNGEGLRVTLFVTGCAHACPGCHNRACWNRRAGLPFTPEVQAQLLDLCEDHDGLSLSGGDPLLPANRAAIAALCAAFKQRYPHKDLWMWTGYRYEEVAHLPLLCHVDVLIDGRYRQDEPTQLPWRGSGNQRLIRLATGEMA